MLKFKGLFTAQITPFTDDNQIDYKALEALLHEQIAAKVEGVVVLGSTGESPTISEVEFQNIISFAVRECNGKIRVIAGTGSNNTDHAIKSSKLAEKLGVDGLLLVNPYYNKPSQEGLFQHFFNIADSVGIPIMLYNVQGRTAVNLQTSTLLRLSQHKNIIAVKEASGNIEQIMEVINLVPKDFAVLSGDDAITYPLMVLGGHGVVSVISNILPVQMNKMMNLLQQQEYSESREMHYKMLKLMNALLSVSSNPVAIKTLLAMQGKVGERFRLPLWPLEAREKEGLSKIFNECRNGLL